MEDFTSYAGHDEVLHGVEVVANLSQLAKPQEIIEDILYDQVVSTHRGGYEKFLIKWKNRPMSDCC